MASILMILLDTDILIDIKRGFPNALQWVDETSLSDFGITGITAMEIIMGSRDKQEQRINQEFVNRFRILWPESEDFRSAYQLLAQNHLATQIGIADCIITAISIRRGARLLSFNVKHFAKIPDLDYDEPYER